jgi:PAS domain S-box-containing protein
LQADLQNNITSFYIPLRLQAGSFKLKKMNEKIVVEKNLLSNESIYQKMIVEIEDYAIILLDLNGNVQNWNKGAEKIKGYTAQEVIGKHYRMFFIHADQEDLLPEKFLLEAIAKGKLVTEGWRLKKDGTPIWISSVLTALHEDKTNEIIGFTKVVRDYTAKKKSEEYTEFLSNIVRNIYDPIISTDNDFIIIDWNKAAEDLFEWKKEEVLGKPAAEILKITYPQNQREDVLNSYKEKGFWQGEAICYAKNGKKLNMSVTLSSLKNQDGIITGTVALARDVSQQKRTEQALEQINNELEELVIERTEEIVAREKRFQSLVENDYTITALLNEKFETIYRSPSAKAILGWSDEDRKSLTTSDVTHPDDRVIQKKLMKDMLMNPGKPIHIMFRSLHKEGHYVWIEGIGVNRLDDPNVKAIVINMHDITEQKKSEDSIKENEEKYRLLIERISDGFIALDKDYRYTFVNKKIGEMTGKDPLFLIGKKVWEVFPEAVGSETYNAFLQAFEEQRYISNIDYYEQLNLWQENHIYPSPNGLSIFIRDISERKRAEIVINELNENLEERVKLRTEELTAANKALESFSYMVSHDLQSPLRTLIGFTNIILEKHSPEFKPELKELFNFILNSSRRMNSIVDDLLKLAKFGNEKLTMTSINMNALFQRIWDNLIQNTPSNAQLEIDELPNIKGDESMMEQVVINLLSNAIKYSSKNEQPHINVGYFNSGEAPTFFIKDNGVGFNMEYYNKLFGAFQRLHAARDFEGTGIGLLLVKKIIENHGGLVWAESKVNEGATFYFTIPEKV